MKAAGGEGGIRTPGTGFSPVQQISNLPCSATPAPLRGGGSPVRERLFGGTGLVRLAQGLALVSAMVAAACRPGPKAPATARGRDRAPVDPGGHARHDPRRRDRPRGRGHRDARVHGARRARPPLPPGVRDGARDAAVARFDAHGALPAGHGVHENARVLARDRALAAERLQKAGYRTAAFVSGFVLARRFGLARGFEVYDDELPAGLRRAERRRDDRRARSRTSRATRRTAVALGALLRPARSPTARPSPSGPALREGPPYLGEVAAMDAELGRLRRRVRDGAWRGRRRSWWWATTARGSASTASRSTAGCSTRRRCGCRWCSWARASAPA